MTAISSLVAALAITGERLILAENVLLYEWETERLCDAIEAAVSISITDSLRKTCHNSNLCLRSKVL